MYNSVDFSEKNGMEKVSKVYIGADHGGYESKEILGRYHIQVPRGDVVESAGGIETNAPVMLKAQIPLGGRGKSGGVIKVSSLQEAKEKIDHLLSTVIRGSPGSSASGWS